MDRRIMIATEDERRRTNGIAILRLPSFVQTLQKSEWLAQDQRIARGSYPP